MVLYIRRNRDVRVCESWKEEMEILVERVDEMAEAEGSKTCSALVLYVETVIKWGWGNNVAEGRQGEDK